MNELSASHAKAVNALIDGRADAARREYNLTFLPSARRIYTLIVSTPPERYAKVADWGEWSRQFYILSLKARKALQSESVALQQEGLDALRAHFVALHRAAGCLTVNDLIYQFHREAKNEKPAIERLKALRQDIEKAAPPSKNEADANAFKMAMRSWANTVDPLLNAGKLERKELVKIRAETTLFYKDYGIRFE